MFVSHLERLDLLVTPIACSLFLWDRFLCRGGIREVENQGKEAQGRDEKNFLEYGSTSSQNSKVLPDEEGLLASDEQGDDGPSEKDNQEHHKLFYQFRVHESSSLLKGWRGFVFLVNCGIFEK